MAEKKTPKKSSAVKKPKAVKAPKAKAKVRAVKAKIVKKKSVAAASFVKTNKPVVPLRDRPLSPHLSVYRPQITSVLSILHRATGVALYLGGFVLAALIVCLAYGPQCFNSSIALIATPVGVALFYGWAFCLFYHFANGIRHLAWDIGKGFEMCSVKLSGLLVLFVSLSLTAAVFFIRNPEYLERLKELAL